MWQAASWPTLRASYLRYQLQHLKPSYLFSVHLPTRSNYFSFQISTWQKSSALKIAAKQWEDGGKRPKKVRMGELMRTKEWNAGQEARLSFTLSSIIAKGEKVREEKGQKWNFLVLVWLLGSVPMGIGMRRLLTLLVTSLPFLAKVFWKVDQSCFSENQFFFSTDLSTYSPHSHFTSFLPTNLSLNAQNQNANQVYKKT